jgi:hypothetical protein
MENDYSIAPQQYLLSVRFQFWYFSQTNRNEAMRQSLSINFYHWEIGCLGIISLNMNKIGKAERSMVKTWLSI